MILKLKDTEILEILNSIQPKSQSSKINLISSLSHVFIYKYIAAALVKLWMKQKADVYKLINTETVMTFSFPKEY